MMKGVCLVLAAVLFREWRKFLSNNVALIKFILAIGLDAILVNLSFFLLLAVFRSYNQ